MVKVSTAASKPRKQATQPESAAPPLPTDQLAEALSKLTPEQFELVKHLAGAFADDPAPASEPQPEATESEKAPEFESVHIITRHVLARLMTAELGAMVCPPDDGFEAFSNTYWLIEKAVQKALTWLDMDDAHKAAVYYSLSVNQ